MFSAGFCFFIVTISSSTMFVLSLPEPILIMWFNRHSVVGTKEFLSLNTRCCFLFFFLDFMDNSLEVKTHKMVATHRKCLFLFALLSCTQSITRFTNVFVIFGLLFSHIRIETKKYFIWVNKNVWKSVLLSLGWNDEVLKWALICWQLKAKLTVIAHFGMASDSLSESLTPGDQSRNVFYVYKVMDHSGREKKSFTS